MKSVYVCPECGSKDSFWRTGVYFDHEKKCCKCGHSWCPRELYDKYIQLEQERLEVNTFRE